MVEFFNYAQLIIGPAGSGKSTYCKIIQQHALNMKRTVRVINLDPAAENINYQCDIDVRELITVEDVMNKKKLGPNGALVYCMDYLYAKFEWLETQISSYGDNQYFLIDCPGQLELFSHYPIMKQIITRLKKSAGMNVASVFCLDSTFTTEYSKFISGSSIALASMIQLELPHINVLTKVDLINNQDAIESLRDIDVKDLLLKEESLGNNQNLKFFNLNKALVELLDNYSLINLLPLNINDEESINEVLYDCDHILQYYENQEPKDEYYNQADKILEGSNEDEDDTNNNFMDSEYLGSVNLDSV